MSYVKSGQLSFKRWKNNSKQLSEISLRHHPKHTFSQAYYEIKAWNVFPSFIIHYNSDYTENRRDPEDEAFTFDLLSSPRIRICLSEPESTTPLIVLRDDHTLPILIAHKQPSQMALHQVVYSVCFWNVHILWDHITW